MDVPLATESLERLAPYLADDVRVARASGPSLSESEIFDAALRLSLARLRFELNRQTFEFLRHKVIAARGDAAVALAALRAAKEARRRWPPSETAARLHEPSKPRIGDDESFEWDRHARFLRTIESIRQRLSRVLVDFAPDERRTLIERMATLQLRYEYIEQNRAGQQPRESKGE